MTGKKQPTRKVGGKPAQTPSATVARRTETSETPITPGGDVERLTALRARLEAVLADPDTSARDLASVSREYRQTLVQLAEIAPAAAGSVLDEIAARRVQRRGSP